MTVTCRSFKLRAILKIPSIVRRTYALSVNFKMKSLGKALSSDKTKTNQILP